MFDGLETMMDAVFGGLWIGFTLEAPFDVPDFGVAGSLDEHGRDIALAARERGILARLPGGIGIVRGSYNFV